jgi:hypothetical protein
MCDNFFEVSGFLKVIAAYHIISYHVHINGSDFKVSGLKQQMCHLRLFLTNFLS